MSTETFHVLAVCTGNVCRSPGIERLLRARGVPRLTVSSAGTAAMTGAGIDPQTARQLRAQGADTDDFRARQLSRALVDGADVVLTAEHRHRSRVVELVPGAHRKTFTVLEFVAIVQRLPDAHHASRAELVAVASRSRSSESSLLAVPDPYGRSTRHHQRAARQIDEAVGVIATALHPRLADNRGAAR